MDRQAGGFTLIEALVALALIAVLLAIAVPAWTHARSAAASGAVSAQLAASLLDAVNHAAIAGTEVVMCPRTATGQCSGSTNWDSGWTVFADINGNRRRDANETVLVRTEPLADGVHLRTTAGRTRLVIQPLGGTAGQNVTFTLCDSRGPASATALVLSPKGRLHQEKPKPAAAEQCAYG
jgi:type IV fimbrial biogenesis protein FimT